MDFYQSETENLIRRALNLAVRNFFTTEFTEFHGVLRTVLQLLKQGNAQDF